MALTRVNSLLEEPQVSLLIAKNALQPSDHQWLGAVEMDELYDNAIHSAIECMFFCLAKEHEKGLRKEFRA